MAAHLVPLLLVAAALLRGAGSCNLAWIGNSACNVTNCQKTLGNVDNADSTAVTLGSQALIPGGLNYRFFQYLVMGDTVGSTSDFRGWFVLDQKPADYVADCCKLCRETTCVMFRHFPKNSDDLPVDPYWREETQKVSATSSLPPAGGWPVVYPPPYPARPLGVYGNFSAYDPTGGKGNCVLFGMSSNAYKDKLGNTCVAGTPGCFNQLQSKNGAGGAFGVNKTTGLINNPANTVGVTDRPRSYWGGLCNPAPLVTGDPHFVGADGVRFEFNGQIDKSFCLITDSNLHVNMLIGGYVDKRQTGAAPAHNLRSWITGLTFMWKDEEGVRHTLFLQARKSAEDRRGDKGFLSLVTVDGEQLPAPRKVGEKITRKGMSLEFVEEGKYGSMDKDKYEVKIGGLLVGRLNMRAAHPLLQRRDDAYAHFDLKLEELSASDKIHGVLGQTYRHDAARVVKVMEYKLLSALLHSAMHADGETGLGYLDGKVEDYVTSSPTQPDCKFANAFNAD